MDGVRFHAGIKRPRVTARPVFSGNPLPHVPRPINLIRPRTTHSHRMPANDDAADGEQDDKNNDRQSSKMLHNDLPYEG